MREIVSFDRLIRSCFIGDARQTPMDFENRLTETIMLTYLEELTIRLAGRVGELAEEDRLRYAGYLKAAQQDDGGFAGREGGSDLYYTGFGLRGLAVLGELYGPNAERAGEFLKTRMTGKESIVDFLSLIYGSSLLKASAGVDIFADASPDWRDAVATSLNQLRRDDGGFAKAPQGRASSTYHTFLVILCLQLIDAEIPKPEKIREFLMSQQCAGGGFREIRVSKRAGTNPTAAAIGALKILGSVDSETRETTLDFLCDMQTDEGGLRANTRIPIADVLSTFTGMLTLVDLDALEELDLQIAKQFLDSIELPSGGFHAAAWDDNHDVEYTFYGIGSQALLNGVSSQW